MNDVNPTASWGLEEISTAVTTGDTQQAHKCSRAASICIFFVVNLCWDKQNMVTAKDLPMTSCVTEKMGGEPFMWSLCVFGLIKGYFSVLIGI